tara:strand:- start:5029 stop:5211 length:183 start_codon:yes stop_codon:yes gene_type:complete
MTIIPFDKLEQLRREQNGEQTQEQPALYAPLPEPLGMLTGSVPQEQEDGKRGVEIIDFTI